MSVLNTTNNPIAVKSTEPISSQPNSDFILTNKLTSQVVGDDGVGAVRYMAEQMEGVPIEDAIGNLLVNPDKVTGSLNALKFAAQNQKSEILTINSENNFRTEPYATISTQSLSTSVRKTTELTQQPVTSITTESQLPTRETTSFSATNFDLITETNKVSSEITSLDRSLTLPIEDNQVISTSSNPNIGQNFTKEVVVKSSSDKTGSQKQDQNSVENSENIKRDIQTDFKQDTTNTKDTRLAQNAFIEREIIKTSKGGTVEYTGTFPMYDHREKQQQNQSDQEERQDQDSVDVFQSVIITNQNLVPFSKDSAEFLLQTDGVISLVKNRNTELTQFSIELGNEDLSRVETAEKTLQKSNIFEVSANDLANNGTNDSTFISQLTASISVSSNLVASSLLAGADISLGMTNLGSNTNMPITKTNVVANSLSAGAGLSFFTNSNAFVKGSSQSTSSNLGAEFGIRSSSFSAAELRAVPGRTAPPIQNAEFIAQQRIMRHLASLWARSFGLGTGLSIVNEILSHPEKWGIGHELVVT